MLFLNVILGHQGNAIQSCSEIFLTPVRTATIKNEMTIHAGTDMGEKRNGYSLFVGV